MISPPFVIKPTDCGGGGRGISVANSPSEIDQAISHAKRFITNNRMICEEYVEGVEISIDSIVLEGKVYPILLSDKIKADSRYRVATSLHYPAKLTELMKRKIEDIAVKATEALGVSNGVTHIELICDRASKNVKLLEVGIRGGGGHVFSTIMEVVTGIKGPVELAKI